MEEPRHAVLSVGEVFHRKYEVRRCVAVGGMAVVYEVVHRVTRRPAALKVMSRELLSERGMRGRFEQEARITASIESEHLVPVMDAGIDEPTGAAFLVMDLLRGEDLEALLRRRGPLPPAEVMALLGQAARALDAVHAAGIVHRDLKPSNLFAVETESGAPLLKVLDFGIAKLIAVDARTTRNVGTPVYMAPEQVRGDGDIDAAADIYALGHIVFTLLAGVPYWAKESAAGGRALFDAIERGTIEPATTRAAARSVTLPAPFDGWFERATAVDPGNRVETAGALIDELGAVLAIPRTAATPPTSPLDVSGRKWSARTLVAFVAAISLAGAASWCGLQGFTKGRDDGARRAAPAVPSISAPAAAPVASPSAEATKEVIPQVVASPSSSTAPPGPVAPRRPVTRPVPSTSASARTPEPPAAPSNPYDNGAF